MVRQFNWFVNGWDSSVPAVLLNGIEMKELDTDPDPGVSGRRAGLRKGPGWAAVWQPAPHAKCSSPLKMRSGRIRNSHSLKQSDPLILRASKGD
jgi:hypothetical protein